MAGTHRKHRDDPAGEVELPPGVPKKPDYLDEFAAEEWDRVVEILSGYKILAEIDGAALEVYCCLYSEFRATRACPAAFTAAKLSAFRRSYSDLGLSPSSRAKIPAMPEDPKSKNPFEPTKSEKTKGKAS